MTFRRKGFSRRFRLPLGRRDTGSWWWVVAQDRERTVLIGPLDSIEEANKRGFALGCYFESVELPTRDHARASQMVKDRRLVSGKALDEAMERISHDRTG